MLSATAKELRVPPHGPRNRAHPLGSNPPGRPPRLPILAPRIQRPPLLCLSVVLVLIVAAQFSSRAAAPVLDHIFPAAAQVGTSNQVTFVGKFDPWPPRVWVDGPGLQFEPTTNQGVFTVVVATNATLGPRFVRASSAEGFSAPRFLIIADEPQRAEVEPNDDPRSPQVLDPLPATLNGRLERSGDVDGYAVKLNPGETLVAWLEAYTLMSPLDPVLRLLDPQGVQVAWNHDEPRSLDPLLSWTAKVPGTYVLQVFGFAYPADSDLRFAGNARGVYRLHVTTGPVLHHTLPVGVRRGNRTPLKPRGWNLGNGTPNELDFDARTLDPEVRRVPFQPPGLLSLAELPVGDGEESLETEPNDTAAQANPMAIPGAISGQINPAGDQDRFVFTAKKGELLRLEVQAVVLGFPLDTWLAVEDLTGKKLVRVDDSDGADPKLEWTAPDEGRYVAVVGNVVRQGGEDLWYRFEVKRATPSLRLTVADNAFQIEPGKTNEIKVTVGRRYGFELPLELSVTGLPEGVQVVRVPVAEKATDAVLKMVAATNAPAFNGLIQIHAKETGSGRDYVAAMDLVSAGENNGVPQGYRRLVRESISDFGLTVLPPPKPPEEKK